MSAPSVDLIRWGRERARTSVWRGEEAVALITPVPEAPFLSADFVAHCMAELRERGFTRAITGALSPLEQSGFIAAGFDVEARLTLLAIELTKDGAPVVPPGLPLRRVPRTRHADILDTDGRAFPEFWRFDEVGLADALKATPSVRFRMAVGGDGRVAGYGVFGRSGRRGFVQRLAVHPDFQGFGTGRRLLLDGLRWMARQGVRRAVVNTQVSNQTALSLYRSTGFHDEPTGLSVLSAGIW